MYSVPIREPACLVRKGTDSALYDPFCPSRSCPWPSRDCPPRFAPFASTSEDRASYNLSPLQNKFLEAIPAALWPRGGAAFFSSRHSGLWRPEAGGGRCELRGAGGGGAAGLGCLLVVICTDPGVREEEVAWRGAQRLRARWSKERWRLKQRIYAAAAACAAALFTSGSWRGETRPPRLAATAPPTPGARRAHARARHRPVHKPRLDVLVDLGHRVRRHRLLRLRAPSLFDPHLRRRRGSPKKGRPIEVRGPVERASSPRRAHRALRACLSLPSILPPQNAAAATSGGFLATVLCRRGR